MSWLAYQSHTRNMSNGVAMNMSALMRMLAYVQIVMSPWTRDSTKRTTTFV